MSRQHGPPGGPTSEGVAQEELRIHLGVEADFRPARKAHPALLVTDLHELVAHLRSLGLEVRDEGTQAGLHQAYVDDPFGNRIELLERV